MLRLKAIHRQKCSALLHYPLEYALVTAENVDSIYCRIRSLSNGQVWDVVDRGLARGGVSRVPEGGTLEDAIAGLPPDKYTGVVSTKQVNPSPIFPFCLSR